MADELQECLVSVPPGCGARLLSIEARIWGRINERQGRKRGDNKVDIAEKDSVEGAEGHRRNYKEQVK